MERNEVVKMVYKNKPTATLMYIRKGKAFYKASIEQNDILFEVPVDDMGEADFTNEMESQFLLRWVTV